MFSTAVKLANLDDYLESSQDCTISLVSENDKPKVEVMRSSKKNGNRTNLQHSDHEKATVNVSDCLACSGCVTSAENKLLLDQSVSEFMKRLTQKKLVVVSISNQSCASFANYYNCDLKIVQRKLSGLFKYLGAKFVMNSTISEYVALLETKLEFISRLKTNSNLPMIISHCPGWVCYSEKSLDASVIPLLSKVRSAQQIQGILVKTLTLEIYNQLLFLNKQRSYKHYFNGSLKNIKMPYSLDNDYVNQEEILHVAIMPCHDKKLESARESLSIRQEDGKSFVPEVDLVLATSEVGELISLVGYNSLIDLPEAPLDNLWLKHGFQLINQNGHSLLLSENFTRDEIFNKNSWLVPSFYNSNSGGYCEYIVRSVIEELTGNKIDKKRKLPFERQASETLEAKYKENGFSINYCLSYGFRSIQSISRRLSLQRGDSRRSQVKHPENGYSNIHLIEVMACPSGCISGGGQLLNLNDTQNSDETDQLKRNIKFIEGIQKKIHEGDDGTILQPDDIPLVKALFDYLVQIDRRINHNYNGDLPFLRNDFVSICESSSSSLKW
ncbi:NARF-like protein nuclear prelamin A recognition factor [Cryptosporidium felis]|nr:NARF-like protein nuclear prelamin A recognition factor [Cryptosporidium felis]